jgi:eukaryotic-like serine/threonine-protein kinase
MGDLGRTFAGFISYSSADAEIARWLHRRLERYAVPKSLRVYSGGGRSLGRFFLDREEFAAAPNLSQEICAALTRSQRLIVICSAQAARSKWVNDEIAEFRNLGKSGNILSGICADGPPGCFPPALQDVEPLAADFRETFDGREDGFLKLVAGILGVPFGMLKDREAQAARGRRMMLGGLLALFVFLFLVAGAGLVGSLVYSKKASQLALAAIATSGEVSDAAMALALNANADAAAMAKLVKLSDEGLQKLYAYDVEVDELKQRHAWVVMRTAHSMMLKGDHGSAETLAKRAYDMAAAGPSYESALTAATALITLSAAREKKKDLASAVGYAERAVGMAQKLATLGHKDNYQPRLVLAEALHQRGDCEAAVGRLDAAMATYQQALQLYRQLFKEMPDSGTFPKRISEVAENAANVAERTDAKLVASLRLESTRAYMQFLSHNRGRVELHQQALDVAIRAAEALVKTGDRPAVIEALRNAENAMAWLWEIDMRSEAVMQNRERAKAMLRTAEEGKNPFASR